MRLFDICILCLILFLTVGFVIIYIKHKNTDSEKFRDRIKNHSIKKDDYYRSFYDSFSKDKEVLTKSLLINSPTKPHKAKFSMDLTAGNYVVGIDIPEGIYTFTATENFGTVSTYSGIFIANMDVNAEEGFIRTADNVKLNKFDVMSVSNLTLNITAKKHVAKKLAKRINPATESYSFSRGAYFVGEDFEPGFYDITVLDGNGNVMVENRLNLVMGRYHNYLYMENFKHACFTKGMTLLIFHELTIDLTPSK